jgi:hypothetical protein
MELGEFMIRLTSRGTLLADQGQESVISSDGYVGLVHRLIGNLEADIHM